MRIPRTIVIPIFTLPWIAAGAMIAWILIQRFPPNGTFKAATDFGTADAFIRPFLPSERVSVPGSQPDGWTGQRITGDPTYMTARVPGPYDSVDVEIEFRPLRQPLLEFGLVKDAAGKELDLEPLYFEGLMSSAWWKEIGGYVRLGTTSLRLKNGDTHGVAAWDATTTMPRLEDPAGILMETRVSLRGAHDFYLVPAGGVVDVTFRLQDVNRARGNTTAAFRVFRGEEEIKRESIGTSGSRDVGLSGVFEHRVRITDASSGVYRISMQSDDDVFIRSIVTVNRHWVVGPRLNFGDAVGYATSTPAGTAWTNSRHLVAETFHREGLQTVSLGSASAKVTKTHETFRLDRTDSETRAVKLFAPQGDVRFVGDGWFALREDAFFEPKPTRLSDGTDVDREGIDAVVTSFEKPEVLDDGWYRATRKFKIDGTVDTLRFVLSAPGIMNRAGAVDIRRMTFTYRREPLTLEGWLQVLKQEIVNALHRL
jgi:hypothetical protein